MKDSVLIVDDSLTVRMDLSQAFEAAGFRPALCATLAEARQALEREPLALIVLDVLLPDGDGLEFLKEVRSSTSRHVTPILLLSSEAEVRDRIRGIETGADDYVGKPYDAGYVVSRARELLHSRSRRPSGEHATILLVDDSVTFREELGRALEAEGYRVLMAPTGEEGLRIAAAARPTAVVVDGVMPGMDGATVIRKMRLDAALRGMPAVLLTASEGSGAELRALDAGADAFVRKEEDLDVILARLGAVLRSARAVREEGASLLGPKRILAVDDSTTFLQELGAILRGEGYDVVLARSGEQALEMLAAQPVDCILMDLLMPGLDGRETCRRIKTSSVARDIPLIMLTALEDRDAMIDGLSTGADDFISKSSEFEVLKARVRAQLRRKQFEDEHRKVRERLHERELEAAEERAGREIAEARATLSEELARKNKELERKNKELEAFCYSVSHDLRSPLRSIDGFSRALLDDYAEKFDEKGQRHLRRICAAAHRMGELIDDLLELSRVSRAEVARTRVNLSEMARAILRDLHRKDSDRKITSVVADDLFVDADHRLVRVLLENLLGNAWKFTSKAEEARIEVGALEHEGKIAYYVRDNGAGFNMAYVEKLFSPFQRLHSEADFPGTGIGLATVYRIADRHGGRAWADGQVGSGATFFFTLPGGERARI